MAESTLLSTLVLSEVPRKLGANESQGKSFSPVFHSVMYFPSVVQSELTWTGLLCEWVLWLLPLSH